MLLYGCEAWSILAKCHKKRAQVLQNKCLKIIFNAPRYTSISELHDVAALPYIDEILEDRVSKMYQLITENSMIRTMGQSCQWRAKHRNIFTEIANALELP